MFVILVGGVFTSIGLTTLAKNGKVFNSNYDNQLYVEGVCRSDALGQAWIDGKCMNLEGHFRLLPNNVLSDKGEDIFQDGKTYTVYKTSFFRVNTYFVSDGIP